MNNHLSAPPPRLLYAISEISEATNLGQTTVKGLIYTGELDSIKVGRRRLVPVESIDKFIAARDELVPATLIRFEIGMGTRLLKVKVMKR